MFFVLYGSDDWSHRGVWSSGLMPSLLQRPPGLLVCLHIHLGAGVENVGPWPERPAGIALGVHCPQLLSALVLCRLLSSRLVFLWFPLMSYKVICKGGGSSPVSLGGGSFTLSCNAPSSQGHPLALNRSVWWDIDVQGPCGRLTPHPSCFRWNPGRSHRADKCSCADVHLQPFSSSFPWI